MIRDLICKRCEVKVGEIESPRSIMPKKIKLCHSCKAESLRLNKEILLARNQGADLRGKNQKRLRESNPMFREETRIRVSTTTKKQYEAGERVSIFSDPEKYKEIRKNWKITDAGRAKLSQKMKDNNPMSNVGSREKMQKTFKERVDSGQIKYKFGTDHHLWKGNRCLNDACRAQLYKVWTFPILQRDKFTCCKCGCKNRLQVHHIKPLREFIAEGKHYFNITKTNNLPPELFWQLITHIVNQHHLRDGITVCAKCHDEIDDFYHENQKN